jgi:hypothetical protein
MDFLDKDKEQEPPKGLWATLRQNFQAASAEMAGDLASGVGPFVMQSVLMKAISRTYRDMKAHKPPARQ